MEISAEYRAISLRAVTYWVATAGIVAEMGVGGVWDVARLPFVRDVVLHLGYPSYFLVLLGTWKVLGAIAIVVPGRPLLKEWAYAGAFFTYSGAIVSHLTTGYDTVEVTVLAPMLVLTVTSWALRPASRRLAYRSLAAGEFAEQSPGAQPRLGGCPPQSDRLVHGIALGIRHCVGERDSDIHACANPERQRRYSAGPMDLVDFWASPAMVLVVAVNIGNLFPESGSLSTWRAGLS